MTQPSLLDLPVPKRHKTTRQTSRAAYAHGREHFTGRRADVLRHLSAWWNRFQLSPTSAELAMWTRGDYPALDWTAHLLRIRRGLSDLMLTGIIEHVPQGQRACDVSGELCETWRVREIGSQESR